MFIYYDPGENFVKMSM